jgi:hypothetical protein
MTASRRDYRTLRKRLRRYAPWFWLVVLTALGLVAIITSARLAHHTPHKDKWFNALWLEVAKAGVQVVAVGALGGALAAVWQNIRARRDRETERNDKIRDELVSLVALYNDVKAVRRILRSLGLDLHIYSNKEQKLLRQYAKLTEEQADGFREQMLILNRLQLDFEAKRKQFGQTNLLDDDTGAVVKALSNIEDYLNNVLDLWEKKGRTIREGTPLAVVYDGLQNLFHVTGRFGQISDWMEDITKLINKRVFGKASKKTQAVVADIKEHQAKEASSSDLRAKNTGIDAPETPSSSA